MPERISLLKFSDQIGETLVGPDKTLAAAPHLMPVSEAILGEAESGYSSYPDVTYPFFSSAIGARLDTREQYLEGGVCHENALRIQLLTAPFAREVWGELEQSPAAIYATRTLSSLTNFYRKAYETSDTAYINAVIGWINSRVGSIQRATNVVEQLKYWYDAKEHPNTPLVEQAEQNGLLLLQFYKPQ